MEYSVTGTIKSRICSMIANSQAVRDALQYKGLEASEPFDVDDPMTYVWNCIYPFLKDPDTITTTDPHILVGVDTSQNISDPSLWDCCITIYVVVNNDDMKTDKAYIREDLLEEGVVYMAKADLITDAILRAITAEPSKTWIGDIYNISTNELSLNNPAHYARKITLYTRDVNLYNRGV